MRSDWPRIILLFACGLAGSWQLGKVPPLLPDAAAELGLDGTEQGLVASAITFLSIGLFGLAARAASRHPLALGLAIALGLEALGAGLSALAPNATVLILARLAEGFGYVYLIVACPTGMAALARTSRDQGIALSIWGSFVPIGIALGGAAASGAAGLAGWRWGMAVAAIPPAILLLIAALAFRRMAALDHGGPAVSAAPAGSDAIGRAGFALALGFGFFAANFLALMAFLPSRWQALEAMEVGPASAAFAAVSITSVAGSLFVAARLARGGNAGLLGLIGILLQGGFGIAALLVPDRTLSILTAGLAIGLGGFAPAAAFANAPRITQSGRALARLNGWISGLGSAGSFLGAPAMGFALDQAGWGGGAILILGLTLLGAIAFRIMSRASG